MHSPELIPLIDDTLQISKEKPIPINSENNCEKDIYMIDLYPKSNKKEEFEKNNENFAHITIRDINNSSIYNKDYINKIELISTSNSLLILGEELVRKAIFFKKKN